MSLAPLLSAPLAVQLHVGAALTALMLGTWQVLAPKGSQRHRLVGWIWVGLMAAVALTSFGVTGRRGAGSLSWLHILSGFVLLMLPLAVLHARQARIAAHKRLMLALFSGALVVTGGVTLLPGRIMGSVVFGTPVTSQAAPGR
jgi:uncharacterized membrane protein